MQNILLICLIEIYFVGSKDEKLNLQNLAWVYSGLISPFSPASKFPPFFCIFVSIFRETIFVQEFLRLSHAIIDVPVVF